LAKASDDYGARQVFDLAPIEIQVTQHQAIKRTCMVCGKQNRAAFPKGLIAFLIG
tara:strand:+ start:654 stop:818 length:165 start_codon:yes stop_codon:yes gene_type:complete